MRTTGRYRHHLFMTFSAESRPKLEVIANGADTREDVGDVPGNADWCEQPARTLAVPNLLTIMSGNLNAPAHRILHAALGGAEVDTLFHSGNHIGYRHGPAGKKGIG